MDLCLWDYISRIEKVQKSRDRVKNRSGVTVDAEHMVSELLDEIDANANAENSDAMEFESEADDNLPSDHGIRVLWDLHLVDNKYLKSTKYHRPRIEFSMLHPENETHYQRVREWSKRMVPVPVGRSIPRRDREETKERHARLMLSLFKPWIAISDLRQISVSWLDAYHLFLASAPSRIIKLIDNMQVLHECRDSRDDHFAERNRQRQAEARQSERARNNRRPENHDDEMDETEILTHLEDIDRSWSERIRKRSKTVNDCLQHARMSGLINDTQRRQVEPDCDSLLMHRLRDNDKMECEWEHCYQTRRGEWKMNSDYTNVQRADATLFNLPSGNETTFNTLDASIIASLNPPEQESRQSMNEVQEEFTGLPNTSVSVRQTTTLDAEMVNTNVDPDIVARDWSLNPKQKIAYRLIVDQCDRNSEDTLSMIITGAAGTGKSRIIHAAQDFLSCRNEAYRFRLTSFTGIAAQNIEGVTLHSALSLSTLKSRNISPGVRKTLIKLWANIDFLFIDEYSMIGCHMLYKIHLALTVAKECSKPFGGINIIFAGDFCQLPAVGDTRLYTSFRKCGTTTHESRNLDNVYGRLLWLSIRNIIVFQTVERQRGTGASELISLLSRLREGRCTKLDYEFLCTRLAKNLVSTADVSQWKDAPIIVTENATKDALNIAATQAYARQTGRHLYWYHSTDTHQGDEVQDLTLKKYLADLPSNSSNHRLGRLPLVIGMPVMIMTNFDVSHGIVNGRVGILKSVNYYVDSDGCRCATSCIVESDGISGEPLPGLDTNQAVALQDQVEMNFTHPHSKKRLRMKRTQLPIQPAFSITAYKSQSLSLDHIVIDLQSCSGSEAPYVMASRVKSLDGLMILRPFHQSKICCLLQQDVHDELKRQRILELSTLARHGEGEIAEKASADLTSLRLQQMLTLEDESELNLENCNLTTLIQREDHVLHQISCIPRDTDSSQSPRSSTKRNASEQGSLSKRRRLIQNDTNGKYLASSAIPFHY